MASRRKREAPPARAITPRMDAGPTGTPHPDGSAQGPPSPAAWVNAPESAPPLQAGERHQVEAAVRGDATLADQLPVEIARNRELSQVYAELGPVGMFGKAGIDADP